MIEVFGLSTHIEGCWHMEIRKFSPTAGKREWKRELQYKPYGNTLCNIQTANYYCY